MSQWIPLHSKQEWADTSPVEEFSESVKIGRIAYNPQCNR